MTKLTAPTSKKLTALGFKAKNEEDAKTEVNAFLIKNGIEGMEDEDLETLIDLAESFVDVDETPDAEGQSGETEEELEELSKEEEIPAKKAASKVNAKKPVVVEEDEEEVPAKKAVAKPTAKETAKPAAAAKTKPVVKETAKKEEVAKTAKPTKLNPKDVEEDRVHFEFLKALFPDEDYLYAWISNAGVTVKYKGKNSNRAVLSLENGSMKADGTFVATLYLPTFNGHVDGLTENGIDHEICWSGVPFIKALDIDELNEILAALLPNIEASVNKLDKKLGENRNKMEENLKKSSKAEPAKPAVKETAKPAAKAVVKTPVAPVVDKVAAAKAKIAEAKTKTKKVVVEEEE